MILLFEKHKLFSSKTLYILVVYIYMGLPLLMMGLHPDKPKLKMPLVKNAFYTPNLPFFIS